MIEVEAKARILRPEKIRELAQKISKYKGKERKIDDYYTLEDMKKYPTKSLRVRKKGNIYQVNFKKRIEANREVDVKNENEFEIEKIDDFLRLLEDFGFKKWMRKEKYTEIYEVKKNFHVELNHLKNLGWFVEVEYLCKKNQIDIAKKNVMIILSKLGINKKDIETKGYTRLLWENNEK
jgi:predicted adenylyl cyclase CyaB